ncbi:MAG: ferredoxin family protein [Candidatus Hodarchaeota archaeon]
MLNKKVYVIPESNISNPITFNPDICIGCNICIETCQVDLFMPNPENNKPPIMLYPGECWYCGCCVMECPKPGAIKLNAPLMNRVHWKRKKS